MQQNSLVTHHYAFPSSIRLRESYLRQQIQIQKLRERIKELEAMTSLISKKERQEFHKEFQKQHAKRDLTEGDTTVPSSPLPHLQSAVIPVPYLEQLEHVHRAVLPIQAAAADAAYDFPLAHRALDELGIRFFVRPQTAHDRTGVELKRDAFRYEESLDAYVCPNDKLLKLNTLHRSASGLYWLYLADRRDCQSCPLRPQCLRPEDRRGARKLEHSYFMSQRRKNLERRTQPEYREALRLRQIWCEGTFAIQKHCHNLTQLLRRGREAAEDHCLLSAAALNLKRLIRNAD